MSTPSWAPSVNSPYYTLCKAFLAWKSLLLVVAVTSPGPGYDTSSSLFLADSPAKQASVPPLALAHLIGKLTRWDAIYFVKAANRGYLYEQEWAFGWGFTRLIALCTAG